MKRAFFYLSLAAAMLLLGVATANAGSIIEPEEDEPIQRVDRNQYNWTGFWLEGSVGGDFSNTEVETHIDDAPSEFEGDLNGLGADGVFGCAKGGYDHYVRGQRIIVGLAMEGCLSNKSTEIGQGINVVGDGAFVAAFEDNDYEEEYSASPTAHLGFLLWDHTALFVKGGYRWSKVDMPLDMGDQTFHGWVVGAEAKSFVAENVTVGVGVDYTNYREEEFSLGEHGEVTVDRNDLRGMLTAGYRF